MSSVGALTRGPTCSMFLIVFRTCKLSNSNFTMASVDILYIDITRRWSGSTPDSREAGNTHTHRHTHLCRPFAKNKTLTKKQHAEDREPGILETRNKIMCSEIIACHSLSDSLWHCASVIEMSWDHNVTAKESIRHELFRLCTFREECLRGEADGWRSHGPGWKGLYGGDCGLNLEWAHTYSGRLKSESVISVYVCEGGFARRREKMWNCYWRSLVWSAGEKFPEDTWRNVCKCSPAPNSPHDPW